LKKKKLSFTIDTIYGCVSYSAPISHTQKLKLMREGGISLIVQQDAPKTAALKSILFAR
jgi:hypothetical protein